MANQRKNVVFLINSLGRGGAEVNLANLIAKLQHPKDQIYVISLVSELENSVQLPAGVKLVCFDFKWPTLLQSVRLLRKTLRQISPYCINSHSEHCHLLTLFSPRHTRIFWSMHTNEYMGSDPITTRIISFLNTLVSRSKRVSRVVACGESNSLALAARHYSPKKTITISNGLDPEFILSYDEVLFLQSNKVYDFVHIGRMHPVKDHANFIKSLSMINRKVKVLFIGRNVTRSSLELSEYELELAEIDAIGEVSQVHEYLKQAKFLVISSSYGEALPLVGIEALANGTPVITTDVGGCKSFTVENWQLVPPNDPHSLSEALTIGLDLSQVEYLPVAFASVEKAISKYSSNEMAKSYSLLFGI